MLGSAQIPPTHLQESLRILLAHRATCPLPGEDAATMPHALPPTVTVDPGAWIAWCLVGLRLFDGPHLPPYRVALAETRRVLLALAMLRHRGNLSRAAKALQLSRKIMREHLRVAGLYPWAPGDRSWVSHPAPRP